MARKPRVTESTSSHDGQLARGDALSEDESAGADESLAARGEHLADARFAVGLGPRLDAA